DSILMVRRLPDSMHKLLSTIDADLLLTVLERALNERNLAVALPVVRVLGDRGDVRAAQPTGGSAPRGLVRALYYPDRRVQFAAAKAIVRMPAATEALVTSRVVEILGWFLAAEQAPRALVAFAPEGR